MKKYLLFCNYLIQYKRKYTAKMCNREMSDNLRNE